MLIIPVKDGNLERALKAFKYKVKKTKLIEKLRELKQFEKPSSKRLKEVRKAKYIQSKNIE